MIAFLELWNTTKKFDALTQEEQGALVKSLIKSLEELDGPGGIEMVGWGTQLQCVDKPAPYKFFAIWHVPDVASMKAVQCALRSAGWYEYVEQVNVAGELLPSPTDLPLSDGTSA